MYQKHQSFVGIHARTSPPAVGARLARCRASLDTLSLEPRVRAIVSRACEDLLDGGRPGEPRFELHENVATELSRIDDAEIPRYLYYRYRYELNPEQQVVDEFPPCLQVEPTSICNYRCVFCYQTDSTFTAKSSGHLGLMSLDTFKRVIDQAEGRCEAVTLASRGEPLMARDIDGMLAYAAGKFLALKINTNAWFLDEKRCHAILSAGVNTVVFSADAAEEPTYSRLRVNGKLDRIVANITQFRDILHRHYPNSRTITRVSGVQIDGSGDFTQMDRLWGALVDQVAFVKYNPWENTYEQPVNGMTTACSDLWRRMFVWWDGRVNPCDNDYKSTLSVGQFQESDLSAIWQGSGYTRLRDAHRSGQRQSCSPCNRCSLV